MPYSYYLKSDILLFYYNEIKKSGSTETDVDNFYNNFLRLYFPMEENYGIEQESRPLKELGVNQRTNFTVRYIKNGILKKVILLEDKLSGKETSASEWRNALNQVVRYATLVRAEDVQNSNEILYLIVNMGTYLRFYQINPGNTDGVDFGPTEGKIFELAADEEEVHTHFSTLRNLTHH
ncbi:hypothetical protein K505DRAFT_362020 [Melanomma pulvis-pyrius CBS 109.77]|uniref:Uncharacterized protein n=1 Tax=Melanomma pulvis-pyrius CBS 109.77 TaxID=1314802 RepID=A0A6A6XAE0_9PLEO|nr:hypothetical protein K505DRAFT_362020 [Melanomma pulvis-pyrius CBS 109.77]